MALETLVGVCRVCLVTMTMTILVVGEISISGSGSSCVVSASGSRGHYCGLGK